MVFECWRPVRGYIGLYLVSDKGRVKNQRTGKVLKPDLIKGNYHRVRLYKDSKYERLLVHILVWEAFKYPIPDGWDIDHLDFIRNNNCIENLLARPASDNRRRISKDGRERNILATKKKWEDKEYLQKHIEINKQLWKNEKFRKKITEAIRIANSKPVIQYDLDGNFIKEWSSLMEIERELGFNHANISKCCLGKQKTAYGFIWRYAD